jgi:hypothetical protein
LVDAFRNNNHTNVNNILTIRSRKNHSHLPVPAAEVDPEETAKKAKKNQFCCTMPSVDDDSPERQTGIEHTVNLVQEVWASSELLFSSKLTWLLIWGPVALVGDATGLLGEAACFCLSGIALIPCAER